MLRSLIRQARGFTRSRHVASPRPAKRCRSIPAMDFPGHVRALVLHALALLLLAPAALAIPGDADGNGVLDLADARTIALFLTKQLPTIPGGSNADANQDYKIDIEDAYIIAQRLTGRTTVVVVAPRYGRSDAVYAGRTVRVEVFQKFFPFQVNGGTVRIRSTTAGYDSGDQALIFERDGRSLYYHWNTTDLSPASDYTVQVTLDEPPVHAANATAKAGGNPPVTTSSGEIAPVVVEVGAALYEPPLLQNVVDAYCPAPGIPLEFRRVLPQDSANYPYLGPLGRGWVHSYDLCLEEYTDGRIAFHGPYGFNRFFTPEAGGTYTADPGDYGALTRDANGVFQLREKNGFIYRFRANLRLDFMEDANGNRVSAIYDGNGYLVEIRHSCGKSLFLTNDTAGHITSLTDHAGRVTTYEYKLNGQLYIRAIYLVGMPKPDVVLTKVTDPAGNATEYTYNLGQSPALNFRLESVAKPDNRHLHLYYNSQGRVTRRTGSWGANTILLNYESPPVTNYAVPLGRPVILADSVGAQKLVEVNDHKDVVATVAPDGGLTVNTYDPSRNRTQAVDPLSRTNRVVYNEYGDAVQVIDPLGSSADAGYELTYHKPVWITDALNRTVNFDYDGRGNMTTVTFPDGTHSSFTYDAQGNRTVATDGAGNRAIFTYNSQGLLTTTTNALGHAIKLAYTPAGDLSAVTNARGYAIAMTRDVLGRLTRRTYADGSHEDYAYNPGGKVTSYTNRRGQRITYTYDDTGRLTSRSYPSGKTYYFLYDTRGLLSSVEKDEGGGRMLEIAYERDLSRRLTKVQVPGAVAPQTYDVSYAYDTAGNRTLMAFPDGYTLHYTYDAANRLTRISDTTNGTIVTYQYDAAGRRTKRTLGNGTYATYTYDDMDRLTALVNSAPGGAVQSQFAYTYNAAGIRTSMTTLEGVHNYTYDKTYQLTRVQYPDGVDVRYAFDPAGNRTNMNYNGTQVAYTVNALDQYTYTEDGHQTLTYNASGDLSARSWTSGPSTNSTTYGWDEDDRLVSVTENGRPHLAYQYDYAGRLIAKNGLLPGGRADRYIWDEANLVMELSAAAGQSTRTALFIYGAAVDEVPLIIANGSNYWCQQDGLGSVVGSTADDGAIIATCSYDVYGNTRNGTLDPVPQRLAGMRWDASANLYYVRARWYSPRDGRFVSPDPIGLNGGVNFYSYAGNDPLNARDPVGLDDEGLDWRWHPKGKPWWIQVNYDPPNCMPSIPRIIPYVPGKNPNPGENAMGVGYDIPGPEPCGLGTVKVGVGWNVPVAPAELPTGYDGMPEDSAFPDDPGGDSLDPEPDSPYPPSGPPGPNQVYPGGTCPTFIQSPPVFRVEASHLADSGNGALYGSINIPVTASLLRSDIPLFGMAAGKQFESYRIEVGAGTHPAKWETIETSSTPCDSNTVSADQALYMQGDIDIRGNLATWNCGLSEWVHLPWHPPEESLNYNGVYTIRLVVEGTDGKTVEDRVTCEVGRVVAQCLPGQVVSPDGRVKMLFPEQALLHPFRVFTILPLKDVGEEAPVVPKGAEFVGDVYRIREPGERFIKDVVLEFAGDDKTLGAKGRDHVGICRYDAGKKEWVWLTTAQQVGTNAFTAVLTELPAEKATYALMRDSNTVRSSAAVATAPVAPLVPARPGVLVDNTFEKDLGSFKQRDRLVGATLSLDNQATPDGSYCLKLVNENFGGNFSSTVLDRPFDVREYPVLGFDYRIGPDVTISFLLKVNGRWYDLRLNGMPVDYRNKDVNIANLGSVEGVVADSVWHTANIDLRHLLRQKTRNTRIDEIILADWSVGGYMKLEFGRNPRNATLYLDNVRLLGTGVANEEAKTLAVDDFEGGGSVNALNGTCGSYCTPGSRFFETALIDQTPVPGTTARNRALQLSFDMTREGSYGGYWTSLQKRNLADFGIVHLRLKGDVVPAMEIGIRNAAGVEGKSSIVPYVSKPDPNGWRSVQVPMRAFRGCREFSSADVLFLGVSQSLGTGKGEVIIDDIRIEPGPQTAVVRFDGLSDPEFDAQCETKATGAAAVSTAVMPDPKEQKNSVCRVSYGGSIGRDYGANGGFSYALWELALNGMDGRPYEYVSLRVRGEKGGETPNFYLSDGARRVCLRSKDVPAITTEWQEMRLPLAFFEKNGVGGIDLSHLEGLQLTFEWSEQSGTVYVDDIAFGPEAARVK